MSNSEPVEPVPEPVDNGAPVRKDLIANQIIEKAAEFFADRGFQGTGIRDIAEAMNMSRPAVYHYFDSKEKLLEEVVGGLTTEVVGFLETVRTDTSLGSAEKLERAIVGLVRRIAAKPAHMRLLAANERGLPVEIAAVHRDARHRALENVSGIIAEGVAAGELRPVDEHLAALALFGMCNWIAWWFHPDSGRTEDEIATEMSRLVLDGLLRPDSRRGADGVGHAIGLLREDLGYLERLLADERAGP